MSRTRFAAPVFVAAALAAVLLAPGSSRSSATVSAEAASPAALALPWPASPALAASLPPAPAAEPPTSLPADPAPVAAVEPPKPPEGHTAAVVADLAPAEPAAEPSGLEPCGGDECIWDRIAQCESGGDWSINTGNGYYGGLQEDMTFWNSYKDDDWPSRPDLATRDQQIEAARRARDSGRGYGPWPVCGRAWR